MRSNPAPTAAMRSRVWYHGTPSLKTAERIAIEGIRPPTLALVTGKYRSPRSMLAPVRGRVYLTPDIAYAQIYALGANMAGSELPNSVKNDYGRYGYVLVVPGSELVDLQPDEDEVGELLSSALLGPPRQGGWIGEHGTRAWTRDPSFMEELARFARKVLTAKQLWSLTHDVGIAVEASAGKRALKKMSDAMKLRIIALDTHVSHAGPPLHPVEAWEIDRERSPELKADGSNFFNVATLVWRHR